MSEVGLKIAVLGATGLVGREMVKILSESNLPIDHLTLLSTPRSAGETISFKDKEITVQAVSAEHFKDIDIALFSAGKEASLQWAPVATGRGAYVIDNSSAYRSDPLVPLIVPEINRSQLSLAEDKLIIANPNCSTIQMLLPLALVHKELGVEQIVVSTYQAVSGKGQKACEELSSQSLAIFRQMPLSTEVFGSQIAFNCQSFIGAIGEDGYCEEENKMINESRKILGDNQLEVVPTTIRVPVFSGHSLSTYVKTKKAFTKDKLNYLITNAVGVTLAEPTDTDPISIVGENNVRVSRIRLAGSDERAFTLWSVADNIRKGAALNAVQIAECLLKDGFCS